MKVLNHGYIELVSSVGNDLAIINAARVSYNRSNREFGDSESRLLRYLLSNSHTSPFEHVVFTFNVKAPIFVFRQWHRHRTWSFNEVSARYTELPDEFYIPDMDVIGVQSKSSKQARELEDTRNGESKEFIVHHFEHAYAAAYNAYRTLLNVYNVPRELARSVLPVATYSSMYATCDLHNLLHFLKLRLHAHAQYEIRVYAEAILKLIEPIVPNTIKVWKELNEIG